MLKAALTTPFILRSSISLAADTHLKFSLAAPFDGSTAPFFLADQQGWYREAGLACQFDSSGGSGEAVTRVGSGVYDLGIGDINVMTEFNGKNPDTAIRTIYMLYYGSPLCAATLTRSGITKPSDLAGRKIGAAAPDGAYRLFPAYAKAAKFDGSSVAWSMVGLQLREAVLSRGDVEAILGFDSTMFIGLLKAGVAASDIRFLYYNDVGLNLYSNGVFVSQKLQKDNPDAVKRFVAVTARAWQAAIANPESAIAALSKQAPLINARLEEDKLRWLIKNQLVTEESRADGLGGVRNERLAQAAAAVSEAFGLPQPPKVENLFDPSFLPSNELRRLPA
jgi:NitT/TauT family transport system substrate-binding protein